MSKEPDILPEDHEQYERDLFDQSGSFSLTWLWIAAGILLSAFIIAVIMA